MALYCGPFTITEVDTRRDNVKLDLLGLSQAHAWFHVGLIIPYEDPNVHFPFRKALPPPDIDELGDEQYEVDRLIAAEDPGAAAGKRRFLVAWTGYNESFDSWEPEPELLIKARDTVVEFCKDNGLPPPPDRPRRAAATQILNLPSPGALPGQAAKQQVPEPSAESRGSTTTTEQRRTKRKSKPPVRYAETLTIPAAAIESHLCIDCLQPHSRL
ncbi:hypothetical protein HK105_201206 [Polyrhizophydium stewartii]|uniref:Chromo domain-containing protein n=1 Tax=Polyrhizophydium stewartii TaxID=2732419 RepID=A0ABR4NJ44_9FUNG